MATYALIHGGGDVAASWDLVAGELRERGHDVVAVDLPSEDESAGLLARSLSAPPPPAIPGASAVWVDAR